MFIHNVDPERVRDMMRRMGALEAAAEERPPMPAQEMSPMTGATTGRAGLLARARSGTVARAGGAGGGQIPRPDFLDSDEDWDETNGVVIPRRR
jgi:hypothetical protein